MKIFLDSADVSEIETHISSGFVDAVLLGADVVTLPPRVLTALYKHPLTDKGLAAFVSDWEGTGQSIL